MEPFFLESLDIDFCFDTSALRSLGAWTPKRVARLIRASRGARLRGAWAPWAIGELTGTNLDRRILTDADLKVIQETARRYDKMVAGRILAGMDAYLQRDAYRVVGIAAPFASSEETSKRRRFLDAFFRVRSASDVEVSSRSPLRMTFYGSSGRSNWTFEIPQHFAQQAGKHVEFWRQLVPPRATLEQIASAMPAWLAHWIPAQIERLHLPQDVFSKLADAGNSGVGSWNAGLLEGYYYARLATDPQRKLKENDGGDIHNGAYLFLVGVLVTNDGGMRQMLQELVDHSRRIMTLEDFETRVQAGSLLRVGRRSAT